MVGYTPQVSVAVWAGGGNSRAPRLESSGRAGDGTDLPANTWHVFLDP